MKMSQKDLNSIVRKHGDWLDSGKIEGVKANLTGANLTGARLTGARLTGADLTEANLWGADLREADLRGANLRGADLRGARLTGANLTGARLTGADLTGAEKIIHLDMYDPRGYTPFAWLKDGKIWINSGCRCFCKKDALDHWKGRKAEGIKFAERYLRAIKALRLSDFE